MARQPIQQDTMLFKVFIALSATGGVVCAYSVYVSAHYKTGEIAIRRLLEAGVPLKTIPEAQLRAVRSFDEVRRAIIQKIGRRESQELVDVMISFDIKSLEGEINRHRNAGVFSQKLAAGLLGCAFLALSWLISRSIRRKITGTRSRTRSGA